MTVINLKSHKFNSRNNLPLVLPLNAKWQMGKVHLCEKNHPQSKAAFATKTKSDTCQNCIHNFKKTIPKKSNGTIALQHSVCTSAFDARAKAEKGCCCPAASARFKAVHAFEEAAPLLQRGRVGEVQGQRRLFLNTKELYAGLSKILLHQRLVRGDGRLCFSRT